MLKLCKEEFDRLMETSPVIPEKIITLFKESFKKSDNYLKIIKPEICDVLVSTDNYRNHWYNEENTNKRIQEVINLQNSKEFASKKLEEKNNKIVSDFKTTFYRINNRDALDSEIIDNLKDKLEMHTLLKIIESLKSDTLV
jgi:hypothetical protein